MEDRSKAQGHASKPSFSLKAPSFGALTSSLSGGGSSEDIAKKIQSADDDYQRAVKTASEMEQVLIQVQRPQAVKALKEMIFRVESALVYHMHRFSELNERLLSNNCYNIASIKVERAESVSRA
jgi:hypothetical protein